MFTKLKITIGRLKLETVKLSVITAMAIAVKFIFQILLGRVFCISWQLDSFFVTITILGLLGFSSDYFISLFIPIFNDVRQDSSKESNIFVDVVIKWAFVLSIFIIIFVKIFGIWIIRIVAPGLSQESVALAKQLMDIFIFALIFSQTHRILTLSLNSLHYYSFPAIIRFIPSLTNICFLFIFVPSYGIKVLALGSVFSNALSAAVLLVFFHFKTGWMPTWRFYHKKIPLLISKSTKMSVNSAIWGLRRVIVNNFASRLGEGSISIFYYADKIITALITVVVSPALRVYYSRISQLMSGAQWDKIRDLFKRVVKINMAVSFMIASSVAVFLPSFLRVLFLGSKFSLSDINIISALVNVLLVYFLILSFENYLSMIVIAQKRMGVVAINAVLGVAVLFLFLLFSYKRYGMHSLSLGYVLSTMAICICYFFFTRKALRLNITILIIGLLKSFFIAFGFTSLGLILRMFVPHDNIIVFCVFPVWFASYVILSYKVLKKEKEIIFAK